MTPSPQEAMFVNEALDFINDQHSADWALVGKLSGGYHLGAYEVTSDDRGRAVLKWQPPSGQPAQITQTAGVIEDARVRGWPTTEWLAFGVLPDGTEYLIQDFIEGLEPTQLDDQLFEQLLSANRVQADRRPRIDRDWSAKIHGIVFDNVDGLANRAGEHAETADMTRRLQALTIGARNLQLPVSDLVHGDFVLVNVLARNGDAYLIDADQAGKGTRAMTWPRCSWRQPLVKLGPSQEEQTRAY